MNNSSLKYTSKIKSVESFNVTRINEFRNQLLGSSIIRQRLDHEEEGKEMWERGKNRFIPRRQRTMKCPT